MTAAMIGNISDSLGNSSVMTGRVDNITDTLISPFTNGSLNTSSPVFPRVPPLTRDVRELIAWMDETLPRLASTGAPVLIIMGLLGNILTIVVMRRPSMKSASATVYLMALAIEDILLLGIGAGQWWLAATFRIYLVDQHRAFCKLMYFVSNFLMMTTTWTVVFVTMQRLICVAFPFKAKALCTRKKAYVSLVALGVIMTIYHSYTFFSVDLVERRTITGAVHKQCGIRPSLMVFHFKYYNIATLMIQIVVPFVLLAIANVVIIVRVILARLRRGKMQSNSNDIVIDSEVKMMTLTLVSVSVIFLLLNSTMAFSLMSFYIPFFKNTRDVKILLILQTLNQFSTFFNAMNSAINFFLYCITGPTFRRELKSLFCRR